MKNELCFYCSAPLYTLQNGFVKCSGCKKKYSPKRIEHIQKLITHFCNNDSALFASQNTQLTYTTVLNYYKKFRHLCTAYCEEQYELHRDQEVQYEEYVYLEKSKRKNKKAIFDAKNFLTFAYGEQVYNILMPSLVQYKESFLEDNLEDIYHKELSKFMRNSKLIKISEKENTITRFWEYFENFIKSYKGVNDEFFAYYLKEAEFKFNLAPTRQKEILNQLYFHKYATLSV